MAMDKKGSIAAFIKALTIGIQQFCPIKVRATRMKLPKKQTTPQPEEGSWGGGGNQIKAACS